ncbi:MAG: hypothetical protein ACRC9O_10230 [Plesiomonas sp.]|uniref:hypothetical protein n=1 Tax=Plesiomonas sp. TaxID=2486279 RepID=UPI003F339121
MDIADQIEDEIMVSIRDGKCRLDDVYIESTLFEVKWFAGLAKVALSVALWASEFALRAHLSNR